MNDIYIINKIKNACTFNDIETILFFYKKEFDLTKTEYLEYSTYNNSYDVSKFLLEQKSIPSNASILYSKQFNDLRLYKLINFYLRRYKINKIVKNDNTI